MQRASRSTAGLRITMLVFGTIVAIEGILDLVLPAQRARGLGLAQCGADSQLAMAVLGASWLVVGISIIAAARNPSPELGWVKLAMAFPLALLVALGSVVAVGAVPFEEVAADIGFDLLFLVIFFVFYPRDRAATRSSPSVEEAHGSR